MDNTVGNCQELLETVISFYEWSNTNVKNLALRMLGYRVAISLMCANIY